MLFYNTITLANNLHTLIRDGYHVDAACVAALSPYATKDLERFGRYTLNPDQTPDAVDYETPVVSTAPMPEATPETSGAGAQVP